MATALIWDERYMWHDTGHGGGVLPAGGWVEPGQHIENPEPKRRLRNLIDASGLADHLVPIKPRPATDEELLRFHTPAYLERLERLSASGGGDASDGTPGDETPFGRGGYEIARLAAGGAIVAVEGVLDRRVENAYALVRPPGHHACSDRGRGFCLLANPVLAALHARAYGELRRVAIIDWDAHHGNGTQDAFYEDGDALIVSIHQDGCYPPRSGAANESGRGAGEGLNINIPLPPGSGAGAYQAAFDRIIAPAIRRFGPEVVIVACGFDASAADPLARLMLHSNAYRDLTRAVIDVAEGCCEGRVVMMHEGGYSPYYVPFCGLAVLETLASIRTDVNDPYLTGYAGWAGQPLQSHQDEVITRVEALHF